MRALNRIAVSLFAVSLASPAPAASETGLDLVESLESARLYSLFGGIAGSAPPWAVESPGAADAHFNLGLDLFSERQESLRIISLERTIRTQLLGRDGETIETFREDPALLGRKFDILLELQGVGSELSIALPSLPEVEIHPSLVFQVAAADVELDFHDRMREQDSSSLEGRGALFGTGLDLTASLSRSCPWFAGASYRFQKLPSLTVDRSPPFAPPRFEILDDEVRLERTVQEISTRAGYTFSGGRIASYLGVRHRWTDLELEDELRYRDPLLTETRLSTRTRLESEATLALAGVQAHLGGRFFGRVETAFGDEDRMVSMKVAYLSRVRVVDELKWPALAALLEHGPKFNHRRDLVTGFGVVAGNWPVVVEYELEKDGFLLLTVSTQGGPSRDLRLPATGTAKRGQRQYQIVTLPDDFGNELQPASFSLHAFASSQPARPVAFNFYGIGAGQGAVASLAIGQAHFEPGEIRVRRGEQAAYHFLARRSFRRVRISVHRHSEQDAYSVPVWEEEPSCTVQQGTTCQGRWQGRDKRNNNVSRGLHTLQVIVWRGARLEDWTFAVAPELVRVSP